MRKGMLVMALVLGALPPVMAGGIFYNSNQSAEYIRSFDRNSAIDNADVVYYNMAGTTQLKDGWTFNLSDQMIFQKATVDTINNPVLGNKEYKSTNPALVVPNAYGAFKKDNWAAFVGVETIGATAIREWKGGLPTLDVLGAQMGGYGQTQTSQVIAADAYANAIAHGGTPAQAQAAAVAAGLSASNFPSNSYLKGSSYYIALRMGGAIQLTPWFSVAAAGRFVTSQQAIVGNVNGADTYTLNNHADPIQNRMVIDIVDKANGFSGELGCNFYPTPGMVINLTYEMATPLDFTTTVHNGKDGNGMFVNGSKAHLDLPQVVRFGWGYQVSNKVRISAGANAYLEKSVDFGMLNNPQFGVTASSAYKNTYEESAAIEYQFSPKWLFSFGLNCNQIGQNQTSTVDISVPGAHANYLSEGTGFQYQATQRLKLNFGLGHTAFIHTYQNADAGDRTIAAEFAAQGVSVNPTKEYNKEYFIVAVGLDYHF